MDFGRLYFYLIHRLKLSEDSSAPHHSYHCSVWFLSCKFKITGTWYVMKTVVFVGRRFERLQSENLNSCTASPEVQYCTIERSWLLKGFWCTSFVRLWRRKVRLYASLALKNVIPKVPLRDKTVVLFLLFPHVQYAVHLLAIHGAKYAAWNLQDGGCDFLNGSVEAAYM